MNQPTLSRPVTTCRYEHQPSGERRQVQVKYPDGTPAPEITHEKCAVCGVWAHAGAPYFAA